MARQDRLSRVAFAQEKHAPALLALPNVIGVGAGYKIRGGATTGELCVQVFVQRKLPMASLAAADLVSTSLEGHQGQAVRTDVIEIGLPEAFQDVARYRPVPGGCSIGPEASVSAGTLGGWACDQDDDSIVLLTNNHVISGLDAMPVLRRVVQPGRLDGGVLPGDAIGSLKRDVTVSTVPNVAGATPPVSVVDAAIGTITVERTDEVLALGPAIYEVLAPALGMNVQKRGRTTLLTTNGRVTSVNVTIDITYRNRTRLGRIANSFIISSTDGNLFSDAGDSGSLIFDQAPGELEGTRPVVGLLFGGGTTADGTPVTIANDINAVFGALNLTTVCTCAARAVLRAILGAREATEAVVGRSSILASKERQFRRLRAHVAATTGFGKQLDAYITQAAAQVGQVLTEDEEGFGLAVRLVEPWLEYRTNADLLDGRLDAATVKAFAQFADYVVKRQPAARTKMRLLRKVVGQFEGKPLRTLFEMARWAPGVRRPRTQRQK